MSSFETSWWFATFKGFALYLDYWSTSVDCLLSPKNLAKLQLLLLVPIGFDFCSIVVLLIVNYTSGTCFYECFIWSWSVDVAAPGRILRIWLPVPPGLSLYNKSFVVVICLDSLWFNCDKRVSVWLNSEGFWKFCWFWLKKALFSLFDVRLTDCLLFVAMFFWS